MPASPDPTPTAAPTAAPTDLASRLEDACALFAAHGDQAITRSGEPALAHARGTVAILRESHADDDACVAAALTSGGPAIPIEIVAARFGDEVATLVEAIRQVLRLRELHGGGRDGRPGEAGRAETLRRMLLAMAADIRVVIVRLASRLQTLRWHAASRSEAAPALCAETLEVLAPLANRLGLWQLKWELEDLAFRFQQPDTYRSLARQLDEKRVEREAFVAQALAALRELLAAAGLQAELSGRPKHIHSIWSKMRSKRLALDDIRDLRGIRVIVGDVRECYEALALIHGRYTPIDSEFDDYIARPKPNGYQSLHTVVLAEDGRPLEVQIRTREMHRFAEYGVASHWSYKERSGGAGGGRGDPGQERRIAWVRQLLAWQREVGERLGAPAHPVQNAQPAQPAQPAQAVDADAPRLYVLTPQARIIELPAGATPVDFAYHVHSTLGHRCRGARVDGQLVPLNTVLANGQTVEILTARPGAGEGPSRDWLNPQLGYVRSNRARTKVRQWFHALELERDIAAGRERVERALAREGRSALAFEELATRLAQSDAQAMFVAVAREEIGPRQLEDAIRGPAAASSAAAGPADEQALLAAAAQRARQRPRSEDTGVLVVGVDLLLTQLARCCRPVPPDPIRGFVTRGRGVSVHRAGCGSFARMAQHAPERVLEVGWGAAPAAADRRAYPVELRVSATDRPGLLRDVSEVFARDRLNVTAVQTRSRGSVAEMRFTVDVPDAAGLARTLAALRAVPGVQEAERG